jgi:EAL domain-containing protein (putative c-di-GMP-specific phosphodiesterase class I)
VQFRDETLADKILGVLKKCGLPADKLEVEITEGLLLQNSPAVQKTLGALRDAGVRIALDDFGTGYSSISYLRSYPIDRLKIDRSFTHTVTVDHATARIVRSLIEMAEALGMAVTAEGVEDEAQRRTLARMGCSHLQGFLLSRPIDEADLVAFLSGYQPDGMIRLFGKAEC